MKKRFIGIIAFILIFALMFVCNIVVFADTESNNSVSTTGTTTTENELIVKFYIVNTGNYENLTVKIYESDTHVITQDCVFDENNIDEVSVVTCFVTHFDICNDSELLFTSSLNAIKYRYISTKTFTVYNTLEEALNDEAVPESTEPEPDESESNQESDTNPSASDIPYYSHPGDVDNNRKITVEDVTYLQKVLTKLIANDEINNYMADFNGDGKININDATNIQRMLLNMDYDCFIKPDYGYLETVYDENPQSDCEIPAERIMENMWKGLTETDLPYDNYDTTYLVTSKNQFFAVTNHYSPSFDDEFFEENALIIRFKEEWCFEYFNSITKIEYENNTLYVTTKREFIGDDPNSVSPVNPTWNIIYSIKKSDIEGIEKLVTI